MLADKPKRSVGSGKPPRPGPPATEPLARPVGALQPGPAPFSAARTRRASSTSARICAINLLAQVNAACDGDLDRVVRCVRLGGFVACVPEFTDHPKVVNGASSLIGEVFGESGAHARAAVGVASLPMNACVEVEGVFAVR